MKEKGVFGRFRPVSCSRRLIFGVSLFFILVSAVPVLETGTSVFPVKMVSDILTPELCASSQVKTISGRIKAGETATALLKPYLPLKCIYELDRKARPVFPLTRLKAGRPYSVHVVEERFTGFEYEIDDQDCLIIRKAKEGYTVTRSPIAYDIRQEVVSVRVTSSLAEAVKQAGEDPSLTWKLSDIFAWDIDFIRDIQPGDEFQVLVDKKFRDGRFAGYADVRAAFFTNAGTEYKAFLHEDGHGRKGYFDGQGKSLEKAFLKAPVAYAKITSKFSNRRFHPILKTFRAHPGVDYAAPKNTPIKTVADGVITSIGYSNTTGRQITVRHVNGYETSYFHMNKYAKGMKKHKKVSQGEVIGYVGKTGLATGYHVCFRMRKDGRPVNPQKQELPFARPVAKREMGRFSTVSGIYTEKIVAHQKLARNSAP